MRLFALRIKSDSRSFSYRIETPVPVGSAVLRKVETSQYQVELLLGNTKCWKLKFATNVMDNGLQLGLLYLL